VKTVFEHIRARLLAPRDIYEELKQTQWCSRFEQLMRNRLIVGAFRYGGIRTPSKGFDVIGSIVSRAGKYLKDGNQEHLVDIANLAMVEFVSPMCHPNPTWSPVDDGEHVQPLEKKQ
jgi:hypothetical protein